MDEGLHDPSTDTRPIEVVLLQLQILVSEAMKLQLQGEFAKTREGEEHTIKLTEEATQKLQELASQIQALTATHRSSNIVHQLVRKSREQMSTLFLEPGKTVHVQPASERGESKFPFLHWCAACLDVFRSRVEDPPRCGKCKSQYWRGDFVKDVRRPGIKRKLKET